MAQMRRRRAKTARPVKRRSRPKTAARKKRGKMPGGNTVLGKRFSSIRAKMAYLRTLRRP